ncbi:hypothetical protein [Flavobacterium frigoris]|uniref:Uncharacterized protein n=1 Tax=Flavobacterium frigoris (strain PS1) TaxID=1086011 RepID=H7FU90_FLAFP|nr:hypothetical protein [Flavobacterium frigoris]EIA08014.1 hypothetical protein HJ01_02882 [Flavobacterium frigoris PS1]
MKKNTLEDYKQAIKAKYEDEKSGDYSSFLINPSRAKLRDLCNIHFKGNGNHNDFLIFRNFFGFDFKEDNSKELKKQTDKFRPLETFFKGETDLTDISGVDLAAVLVNYEPRPLNRFIKVIGTTTTARKEENTTYAIIDKSTDFTTDEKKKEPIIIHEHPVKRTVVLQSTLSQIQHKTISVKQIFKILLLVVIIAVSAYGMKELIAPKKQCMQWQMDHYEIVDCSSTTQGIGIINEIKPIIEEEMKLKKIEVSLKTPFFQKNKAAIWYCKKDSKLEYFNAAGFHPENGKPLKPISQYIITKYIKE